MSLLIVSSFKNVLRFMKNSSAEVTFQPVDVIGGFFDLFDPTCSAQIRDFFFQTEKHLKIIS